MIEIIKLIGSIVYLGWWFLLSSTISYDQETLESNDILEIILFILKSVNNTLLNIIIHFIAPLISIGNIINFYFYIRNNINAILF